MAGNDRGRAALDRDEHVALVIDLGTTGAKVGFATLAGEVLWSENHDLESSVLPGGGAVQDAEAWWSIVRSAAKRGLAEVDPGRVAAVSATGQWASTVPVDADGRPVGPCLLWTDTRGGREARRRIGGRAAGYRARAIASWVRRSGGAPGLDGADPLGHRWYLESSEPEVVAAARWLLEPVDYLSMRFSGEAAASPASMIAAWLTDNRHPDTAEYDPVLVRLAGIDESRLPPLHPTLSITGTVQPAVAEELGLRDDVAVVTGLPDLHSATLASGAVDDYDPHMAIATSSWISCHVRHKKTDVIRQIATVPGALPGRYLVADNHEAAGRCFQWARDVLSGGAAPLGYEELAALAEQAEPGSGGLLFTPWLVGERTPVADRRARGGFHNLSLETNRADLARGVMEGVAYNARWLLEAVEKFLDRRLDDIRVIGGGASDLWCQIHADVLDRRLEQVAQPLYAGLRGAALAAGLALEVVEPDDLRDLVPVAGRFTPNPANREVYDRLYAEFPGLYSGQKKMFARLNS